MKRALFRSLAVGSLVVVAVSFAGAAVAEEKTEQAPVKAKKMAMEAFQGTITAIDAKAGTVSIKSTGKTPEEKSFKVAADAKFRVGEGKSGTLEDFVVGRVVFVNYTKEEAGLMLHKMGLLKLKVKKLESGG